MSLPLRRRLAICLGLVALALAPVAVQAQKALVYCPVTIDNAGCSAVVDALGADATLFPGGVDRGYDGAGGTVDLASVDLSGYSVLVVPSLADDPTAQPLGLLRNAAIAARLKAAFTGRAVAWSGTPDLGSSNLDKKDALIQNLARWARADGAAGRGAGVVALMDASEDPTVRYSWLGQISALSVTVDDAIEDVYDNVETRTATGVAILAWNGLQLGYTNMASGALTSAGGTVDATGGRSTDAVLVTAAGESGGPGTGLASVTTDKQDYAPGETVTVTGAGWEPGETVNMMLHEEPLVHGDRTLSAVADSAGRIFNNSFHPEQHDLGVRFVLSATGATSGRIAQTTFTDAVGLQKITVGSQSPAAVPPTVGAAFPITVEFSGNNSTCSVALTVTSGLPAGATASFSPSNVSASSSISVPSTLTIMPAAGTAAGTYPFTVTGTQQGAPCSGAPNATKQGTGSLAVSVPVNQAPVANTDTYSTDEDNALTIAAPGVLGNDTDAESSALTASLVTGPASGTLTLNANGSFTYTPAADVNGPITFTYRANDGTANSNTATVTINITPVNDAPTFVSGGNQTVLEDAGAQTVAWASLMTTGPANESSQMLTGGFAVSNDNNALFTIQPAITSAGTLTYTPAANAFGSATVTVTLRDNGGTDNGGVDFVTRFFTITVTPVNDAPSFAKGGDQTVNEDAGPQSVPGWATAISAGPDESGQTLAFDVTGNTYAGLFSAGPVVSSAGTLSYTPAANASGTATISLRLTDNGGTANGGVDASAAQTFVITVNSVDDAPTLDAIANRTVKWGTPISITLVAADPDTPSGSLVFSVSGGPAGNTATAAGGTFAWTPAEGDVGTSSFTVTVTDGTTPVSRSFSVTVQPHATAIAYSGDVSGTVFSSVTFKATLTDADAGNAPLAGKTVGFALGTLATSATTASGGAAGLATASSTIPAGTGATSVVATYTPAAGEGYAGSTTTTPFTLNKAAVTVAMSGATVGYDGAMHALTATVTGPIGAVSSPAPTYSYAGTGSTTYGPTATAPRNVGTYQVTASFAGDADYAANSASASLAITTRQLTVSATADNKVYDGNASATVHLSDDRVSGDALTVTASPATFADRTAATGKTVTIPGITVGGADAGNYTFNSSTTALADITPFALTGSITAADKVYDGTTTASITTRTLAGVIGTDVVSYVGGSATFATKSVATGKTVTATGLSLTGGDAGNYSVNTTATDLADITVRTLVVTGTGVSREYDGTSGATVTFVDDRVSGDALTIGYTASFADKNVGNGKPITLNTFSVTGADAGNYSTPAPAGITANITPRALVISATGVNKVYDQATSATVVLADDRIAGDLFTATVGTAAFGDKHVGTAKPISVSGIGISGTDAPNYTFNTTAAASADITPRALVATAHGVDRIYDATTVATVTFTDDRFAGDVITYTYTAAFGDKKVGTAKPVNVTGIALGGAEGGDYTPNTTASTTADITPKALLISAAGVNKTYDATRAATVTLSDDRITGDILSPAYTTALFNNKQAGLAKPVSVTGITLGGTDAPNYTFNTTAPATANIGPRDLAVTAAGIDKVYDGLTAATVTIQDDRIAGDVLTFSYTAAFADANAGTAKTVTVSAITLGGADGGNYMPNASTSTTATIDPRPVAITADPKTKVYGDGDPALTYQITAGNLVMSDAFAGALTRAPGETVGTWAISQGTVALSANYELTFTGSDLTITKAPLTVTATAATKVFGDAVPTFAGALTGIQFNDNITAAWATTTPYTPTSNAGTYTNVIGGTLSDPDGRLPNYSVTYVPATFTITRATPVFSALSSPSVVFATPTTTLTGTIGFAGSGATVVPQGPASVAVTFNGTTVQAPVNSATGAFSASFSTATVDVLGNPYAITYNYNDNDAPDNFTDAADGSGSLTILDQTAPAVSGTVAAPNPVPVGTAPIVTSQISDAGLGSSSIASAAVTVTGGGIPTQTLGMTLGGGSFTRSATKAVPNLPVGVYSMCVTGTDAAGNTTALGECVLVAVYDASGGFVTGGGWITSPLGAYVPNASLTGKATFGFVAKYQKGKQTPDGNTEFQFQAAGLNFKSSSYDWLVVAGNKAQYKGVGTLNGTPGYGFMLTAIDGDDASRKPDRFRMKITGPSGLVYDNQMNLPDTGDPSTVLDGGSIVVHDK